MCPSQIGFPRRCDGRVERMDKRMHVGAADIVFFTIGRRDEMLNTIPSLHAEIDIDQDRVSCRRFAGIFNFETANFPVPT